MKIKPEHLSHIRKELERQMLKVYFAGWRYDSTANSENIRMVSDENLRDDCGTLACTGGWACAYPKFKEQGLYWDAAISFMDGDRSLHGWEALEKFFGLTEKQARYLFTSWKVTYPEEGSNPASRFEHISDHRKLALARIRYHLLKTEAITQARYDELCEL